MRTRFRRAKEIFQKEGIISLILRLIRFLFSQCRVYSRREYYLYERTLKELNEADFMPSIQDFTFKIVVSKEQADELDANGFELPENITKARHRLDKGAVAFCIFVDGKLAHIAWVALTEEAKNSFDSLPYLVDFSNSQACTGGIVTIPEYEGRRLMTYSSFKRYQFLKEKGIISLRSAVSTDTLASNRVVSKVEHKLYGKGRYIRILWWKSWKETPI